MLPDIHRLVVCIIPIVLRKLHNFSSFPDIIAELPNLPIPLYLPLLELSADLG